MKTTNYMADHNGWGRCKVTHLATNARSRLGVRSPHACRPTSIARSPAAQPAPVTRDRYLANPSASASAASVASRHPVTWRRSISSTSPPAPPGAAAPFLRLGRAGLRPAFLADARGRAHARGARAGAHRRISFARRRALSVKCDDESTPTERSPAHKTISDSR
jgi:hypothetical protein